MFKRAFDLIILPLLTILFNYTPSFFWVMWDFVYDIVMFWMGRISLDYYRKNPVKQEIQRLKTVKSYSEWREVSSNIDKMLSADLWRQNPISKHYDYVLIYERLRLLREARLERDDNTLMLLLRSGFIRNFGGIAQKRLYSKLYVGTKYLIEEYVNEVLTCLNYLNDSIYSSHKDDTGYVLNSKQLKLAFFHDAKQSFGSTALILQGGSLFGLCHLGVVRALYFKGLLPRIIGGSAIGASVAALVCSSTDDELIPILLSINEVMGNVDRLNHDVDERYGSVIENVVKKGYSQDILLFLKFVRDTIGNMTFEEAYLKTEKILNIVVHPTHPLVPSLLNYISTPNVIIWTAIYASIGTGVLSDNVKLYVKNYQNEVVPRDPELEINYLKPQDVRYEHQYFSFKKETNIQHSSTPYTRLTEFFNVNQFITSLARPYLAPLISNDLKHYHSDYDTGTTNMHWDKFYLDNTYNFAKHVKNIVGLEIQHRLDVLNKFGILADVVKRFFIDERPSTAQTLNGIREITIVPQLHYLLNDFSRVFDVHKTLENIPYWILVGEISVWPLFSMLWTLCATEFALDDIYNLEKNHRIMH